MSLRKFNYPPLVAMAGASIAVGLPMLESVLYSSASLSLLKSLNVAAYVTNVIAVSVPGRLDGPQDEETRKGYLGSDPKQPNDSDSVSSKKDDDLIVGKEESSSTYTRNESRTLFNPSGWAFAIWGPIYLGEAAFVAAQLFASDAAASALLPQITAPFVAANLLQSLWCASFRPSYGGGWNRFISAGMLAGTGYSLYLVHSAGSTVVAADSSMLSHLLLPVTMHFGWISAAALLNLNNSLASIKSASPQSIIALGYSSALVATALGVGLTLSRSAPVYGLTLTWALAACADGMAKRIPSQSPVEEEKLAIAASFQKSLCWAGSFACAVAAAYAGLF